MSRQSNPLVRFAVERRVTMAMAVLGVMVLGWISLTRLPLEYLPSTITPSTAIVMVTRLSTAKRTSGLLWRLTRRSYPLECRPSDRASCQSGLFTRIRSEEV